MLPYGNESDINPSCAAAHIECEAHIDRRRRISKIPPGIYIDVHKYRHSVFMHKPLWNVENFSVENRRSKISPQPPGEKVRLSPLGVWKKTCCYQTEKPTFPQSTSPTTKATTNTYKNIYIILLYYKKEFSICVLPVKKVCW